LYAAVLEWAATGRAHADPDRAARAGL